MKRTLLIAPCLLAAAAAAARAERAEYLLVELPQGYVLGYEQANDQGMVQEYVPQGETVEKWSEMVTVQLLPPTDSVQRFYERMDSGVKQACNGGSTQVISTEKENGYRVRFFTLVCPTNPQTSMGEVTFIKAIDGRDKLYVVHKAWRTPIFEAGSVPLNEADIVKWTQYMRSVLVCDNRLKAKKCPIP